MSAARTEHPTAFLLGFTEVQRDEAHRCLREVLDRIDQAKAAIRAGDTDHALETLIGAGFFAWPLPARDEGRAA